MLKIRKSLGGLGNLMFRHAYIYAQMREGKIPDIYVHSEKYWEKYKEEIKKMWQEGIGYTDMVSLHIRRGDYLLDENKNTYLDLTNTDFYDKAIAMFPNETFLIFCADRQGTDGEDTKWCIDWANKKGIKYKMHVPSNSEKDGATALGSGETNDLNDMASCKHNIIANSTFGWWASYLNPNPNKKVVCPTKEKWYSDGRIDLPEEFIQI